MAFSFTLPELRAELRALGHDGLPDHLILSFLSQLHLPLPSSSAPKPPSCSSPHSSSSFSSDSSGYDTEASTCSNHAPSSCGYESPKACSTFREYTDDGAPAGCAEHVPPSSDTKETVSIPAELSHGCPHELASCAEPLEMISRTKALLPPADLGHSGSHRVSASKPAEDCLRNRNAKRSRPSAEPHLKNGYLPRSRAPMQHEETSNRATDVDNITEKHFNGRNCVTSVESADIDVDETGHGGDVGHQKHADAVLGSDRTGCGARSIPHQVRGKEHDSRVNADKIIEHYWISVGKEHMRAMHSKSSKEMEQLMGPSVLVSRSGDADTSVDGTGETGCKILIDKVQRCEDELQRLTLSVQAQQCKKPWFLEAARKPRVLHMGKSDFCRRSVSLLASDPTLATDLALMHEEGCGNCSPPGQLCMVTLTNTQMIVEAHGKASEDSSSASLEHVRECVEGACENMATPEERSQEWLDMKIDEADTSEMKHATAFLVSEYDELEEASQNEDKESKMSCDVCRDQRDDPDPSVCSKSSSAGYQHSRSSGDSRSNVSQQMSSRSSLRKPPHNTSQQKRRGGKIDRVARFAEMQRLWKKDTFLAANEVGGKRKGVQSFHHLFSSLHSSNSY